MSNSRCRRCGLEVEASKKKCSRCGARYSRITFPRILILLIIGMTAYNTWSFYEAHNAIVQEPHTTKALSQNDKSEYLIIERNDRSLEDHTRMVYKILINENTPPSREELERNLRSIWAQENMNWDEAVMFAYLPGMDLNGHAYLFARFEGEELAAWKIQSKADEYITRANTVTTNSFSGKRLPRDYLLLVRSSEMGAGELRVDIKTNFPDQTRLLVYGRRPYTQENSDEERNGLLFQDTVVVDSGSASLYVDIDDSVWFQEHEANVAAFNDPGIFSSVAEISSEIIVGAFFSPIRDQPQEVLEQVGARGEYIRGDGAKQSGDLTTYRTDTHIEMPTNQFI
ncbi:MAG: hypothetical protein CMO81_06740 [Waddliaceae bacterium]|nr:hypothetical protein [Waddliaceae bacterium]